MKHTQGEWTQNYIYHGSTNEVKANGKRIALVLQYAENQERVADFETCEANAKLIAAAPDMLEALQNLVWNLDGKQENLSAVQCEGIEYAKAAIKKATQ